MADDLIVAGGASAAPLVYTVPGAQEIILKAGYATFTGTSATSAYLPCMRIIAPGNKVVGEYIAATAVGAGASAEVSFGPFLGRGAGGGMTLIYNNVLAAPAASFDITAIPQHFHSLLLLGNLRTNGAGTTQNSIVQVNGNVNPTTYSYVDSFGNKLQNVNGQYLMPSAAAGADAEHTSQSAIWFHDYAQVLHDHEYGGTVGVVAVEANVATWFAGVVSVVSCATVAAGIARLTILPDAGTAWDAPSSITLYGLP